MRHSVENTNDYWFIVEPYVHIKLASKKALLYNTLDNSSIEVDDYEIIQLLEELLQEENFGVILLESKKIQNKNIKDFIEKLRKYYMGDIIDICLSKKKPIQISPFFNLRAMGKSAIYKEQNFPINIDGLKYLHEINIHIENYDMDIFNLINFLLPIPQNVIYNIIVNKKNSILNSELLSFLIQRNSLIKIKISDLSAHIPILQSEYENISYFITIKSPINIQELATFQSLLSKQKRSIEYIFEVTSDEDCFQIEELVKQFEIKEYSLKPIYTGVNLQFFEQNVFLTKEDILNSSNSIKDIFAHQMMNTNDFGKINIMPNGDIFANLNYSKLGNINNCDIATIIYKEIHEGQSWLRIREQAPCCNCLYQWLCPSPSDYEIEIGRYNLCHVQKGK